MNTFIKSILSILLGKVLLVGIIVSFFFISLVDSFSPTNNRIELISINNEKLYIQSKNWGITGDSQLTIITTEDEKEFEIDSTRQIIFDGLEPFIYKVSNDTLLLILRKKVKIPDGFNSHWKVIQKKVENPTMLDLRRNPEFKRI